MNPTGDAPAVATGMEAITTAVKTALATVSTDAQSLIGDVLPYALAIMGAGLVVSIGIKVFINVTGR